MSNITKLIKDVPDVSLDVVRNWNSVYGSLAKSCRFIVQIRPARALVTMGYSNFLNQFPYLCEAVEMPGRGFVTGDVRYYGPNQKLPIKSQYEDTTLTLLCRSESWERQLFDDWMEAINPTRSFNFRYRSEYECQVDIIQLSESADPQNSEKPFKSYKISLINAYPVLINPQPMTWADDQFQRLSVTFTYHKWKRIGWDIDPKYLNQLVLGRDSRTGVPTEEASKTASGLLFK